MQWKQRNGALAPQNIVDAIDYGCRAAGVPRGIVCAIIEIESAFNLGATNRSTKAAGLLQIKPEYLADYRRYAGVAFDPYSIAAAIAGGFIIATFANTGRDRGHAGLNAWRFAIAAHRWGMASEEARTPADCARVLEVEAMMRANGMWYDTPQPAPEVPVVIQLPMTRNYRSTHKAAFATANKEPEGFMIHTHGCQYVQAWEFPIRWDTTDSEKAVHFFADEHGIIQALPDNVQGWHAGGAANKTYLGVEISEPYTDTPESFAATLRNVRWLVETMRLKHGFPVSKIVGHCEGHKLGIASNHGDPLSDPGYTKSDKKPWANPAMNGKGYFPRNGYSMDKLRADIAAMSGGGGQPVTPPVEPPPQPADKVLFGVSSKRSIKVRAVQIALNLKGAKISVDGLYGAQTKAAMEAFQRTNEISVTGSFTLATLKKLMPQLSEGKHGELVKVLQQMVGTGADRDFGPLTRKAVEKWQKANRLTVDGVVGPVTWTALLS